LNLEKEVLTWGATEGGLPMGFPSVRPVQVTGLEINAYAQELAQVVIWIGYLQWMIGNGFGWREPVLEDLQTIRLQDALLEERNGKISQTVWPKADYIIGNPPFLGGKTLRRELSDQCAEQLHEVFRGKLPPFSDLCCYFFEQAREAISEGRTQRAGLLATNSIRGGANREVLKRIKDSGDIFMAWSDEPWILAGAAVRISIIGFDDGAEQLKELNGLPVATINTDLTALVDITSALVLKENEDLGFIGIQTLGRYDIPEEVALSWLSQPAGASGNSIRRVLRPYMNAMDIVRRSRKNWIVDFGESMLEEEAALYEQPYEFVLEQVKPLRMRRREEAARRRWWIHWRTRPELRAAAKGMKRLIATPIVSKYRVFVWLDPDVLVSHAVAVFAREDDYFFGVLHSRAHEVWSLRMGTSLEDRPRYTPTTTFETFPLPWPPGEEPVGDPKVHAIAAAAKSLNELRENWLNPSDASEADLKKRTLTNLYNARPTWLANAHANLDRAVWTAYGWDDPDPATTDEDAILGRLLALNQQRAAGNS
jgi:type II restriction/modification system DNA methylase subunit YeeA